LEVISKSAEEIERTSYLQEFLSEEPHFEERRKIKIKFHV
jgi:hypothetical protein